MIGSTSMPNLTDFSAKAPPNGLAARDAPQTKRKLRLTDEDAERERQFDTV